jgi:hypothetical protein
LISRRALHTLVVVPVLIAFALALTACGGGGDNDEDPKQVLEETFSTSIDSGTIDLSVDAKAEGEQSGEFQATASGPFDNKGENFAIDLKATGSGGGQDIDFDGGATSAGGKLYVAYKGQDYEVGKNQTGGADPAQARKLLSSANIEPLNWLTDLTNEGTEDVEGTESIHISGSANVENLAGDLQKLIQQAAKQLPGGNAPSGQVSDQIKDSVKEADLDVFSSADDHTLRRLEAALVLEPPEDSDAQFDSLDLNLSVTFADIGEPQTIEAPKGAKSLSELLSGFGGLGGGSSGGAGGNGANSAQSQRYLKCLQDAQGSSEIQDCAKQLE